VCDSMGISWLFSAAKGQAHVSRGRDPTSCTSSEATSWRQPHSDRRDGISVRFRTSSEIFPGNDNSERALGGVVRRQSSG
jgi:hypothetical protein